MNLRTCRLFASAALGLFSSTLFAYKTDFKKLHSGLSLSSGYLKPTTSQSNFDPTRSLGQQPIYFSNTGRDKVLFFRFGLYQDVKQATLEIFGNHIRNTAASWDAAGAYNGAGQSRLSGWGGGAQVSLHFVEAARFRSSFNFSFDYSKVSSTISFGGSELKLQTALVAGGLGWRNEIWLGDLWILSSLVSYQFGFPQKWKVKDSSLLLGGRYNEGADLVDQDGNPVKSRFGGLLVSVGLRLAFY